MKSANLTKVMMLIASATVPFIVGVLSLSFIYTPQATAQQPTNQNTTTVIDSENTIIIPGFNSVGNITSSVEIFPTIMHALKSQIHTSLNDATTSAINAVAGNSSAVAAFIQTDRDFLVYRVFLIDANNNFHMVVVDPGNGKVLSTERVEPSMINMMMIDGLPPLITGVTPSEAFGGPPREIPSPAVPPGGGR